MSEPTKRILLVDDDPDILQVVGARCKSIGLEVYEARNLLTAVSLLEKKAPDLLCIDIDMPTGSGLDFCKMLANDPATAELPIVVFSGRRDAKTSQMCQQLGVKQVIKTSNAWLHLGPVIKQEIGLANAVAEPKVAAETQIEITPETKSSPVASTENLEESANTPPQRDVLMDAVFDMLESEPNLMETEMRSQKNNNSDSDTETDLADIPWVLCIDDDADFSEALKCRLETHGVAVVRAFDGKDGYRKAFMNPASAILLDYEMPNGQGDYVLGRLQDNPLTKNIPVTMLTGVKDKMVERRMLNLGAKGYLTKPIPFDKVRNELAKYIDILATTEEPSLLG